MVGTGQAGDLVDLLQVEDEHVAPVTEDDLKVRMSVEHAGQDQAQELQARLVMPARSDGRQREVEVPGQSRVVRVAHRSRRDLGVQVQRGSELIRGGEDRLVVRVVEITLAGPTEHHGSAQAELPDCSAQLVGGRLRVRRRQHRETLEALWVSPHHLRDEVVGLPSKLHRQVGFQALQAGRGQREDLNVDPDLVHALQAQIAEIEETLLDLTPVVVGDRVVVVPGVQSCPRARDLGCEEVLLERDDLRPHGQDLRWLVVNVVNRKL